MNIVYVLLTCVLISIIISTFIIYIAIYYLKQLINTNNNKLYVIETELNNNKIAISKIKDDIHELVNMFNNYFRPYKSNLYKDIIEKNKSDVIYTSMNPLCNKETNTPIETISFESHYYKCTKCPKNQNNYKCGIIYKIVPQTVDYLSINDFVFKEVTETDYYTQFNFNQHKHFENANKETIILFELINHKNLIHLTNHNYNKIFTFTEVENINRIHTVINKYLNKDSNIPKPFKVIIQ